MMLPMNAGLHTVPCHACYFTSNWLKQSKLLPELCILKVGFDETTSLMTY